MAKNNLEGRTTRYGGGGSTKYFKSITPQQSRETTPSRLSPCTSPGLLAGHYAGCKFSEPPLPSALPPPPQHWMQSAAHAAPRPCKPEPEQLERHLKILLKVQA